MIREILPDDFAAELDMLYEADLFTDVDKLWATAAINAMYSRGNRAKEWEEIFLQIGGLDGQDV